MLLLLLSIGCPEPEPALPTVAIVSPADGAGLTSGDVAVEVEVTDFALVPPEEAVGRALPLWWAPALALAHEPSDEPEGFLRVTVDDATALDTVDLSFTLTGLAAGSHTIGVELLYPDGDAFYPPVRDEITVGVP